MYLRTCDCSNAEQKDSDCQLLPHADLLLSSVTELARRGANERGMQRVSGWPPRVLRDNVQDADVRGDDPEGTVIGLISDSSNQPQS
jgi:hypothetical protein